MNTVKTNILNEQFSAGTLILGIGGGGTNFLDYVQKNSPQPIRLKEEVGNYGIDKVLAEVDKRMWEHLLESLTTNH
jgi:hypothetical protein